MRFARHIIAILVVLLVAIGYSYYKTYEENQTLKRQQKMAEEQMPSLENVNPDDIFLKRKKEQLNQIERPSGSPQQEYSSSSSIAPEKPTTKKFVATTNTLKENLQNDNSSVKQKASTGIIPRSMEEMKRELVDIDYQLSDMELKKEKLSVNPQSSFAMKELQIQIDLLKQKKAFINNEQVGKSGEMPIPVPPNGGLPVNTLDHQPLQSSKQ